MELLDHCPVCGFSTFKHFTDCKDFSISGEIFSIVKCDSCGFLFTNPRPTLNGISKYYNSNVYISHHSDKKGIVPFLYRMIRNIQFNNKTGIILKHIKKPISLIDIGCGTGNFLKHCSKLGWSTLGVEPDEDARREAQLKNIIVHDLDYLKNTTNKFNVITLWHVLEHVHDLKERVNQIQRMLTTDGIAIIAVPNPRSYDAQKYGNHWAAYDLPRHLYHFTKDSISLLFSNYGLNLVETIPMKYDSFYVSLKSEEYTNKNTILNALKGFNSGLNSNIKASHNKEYSSIIYVFKK